MTNNSKKYTAQNSSAAQREQSLNVHRRNYLEHLKKSTVTVLVVLENLQKILKGPGNKNVKLKKKTKRFYHFLHLMHERITIELDMIGGLISDERAAAVIRTIKTSVISNRNYSYNGERRFSHERVKASTEEVMEVLEDCRRKLHGQGATLTEFTEEVEGFFQVVK